MSFIAEVFSDDFYACDNLLVILLKARLWLSCILVQVVLLPASARKLEVKIKETSFFPCLLHALRGQRWSFSYRCSEINLTQEKEK